MGVLRACPICGGEVELRYSKRSNTYQIWHKDKRDCAIVGPISMDAGTDRSLMGAVDAWNNGAMGV